MEVNMYSGSSETTHIRYTIDGKGPTADSPIYVSPVSITENIAFRAAGFLSGERATRVLSASYFLDVEFQLPIMSITMDPVDYTVVHTKTSAHGRESEKEAFMEFFENGRQQVAIGFGMRLHGGASRMGDIEVKKSYRAYFRGIYGEKNFVFRSYLKLQ